MANNVRYLTLGYSALTSLTAGIDLDKNRKGCLSAHFDNFLVELSGKFGAVECFKESKVGNGGD